MNYRAKFRIVNKGGTFPWCLQRRYIDQKNWVVIDYYKDKAVAVENKNRLVKENQRFW